MRSLIKFVTCALIVVSISISCKKEQPIQPNNTNPSGNPPGSSNKIPVANAGADDTVAYPRTTTSLDGSASYDPDGTIISYSWSEISGPSQVTYSSAGKAMTFIYGMVPGTYRFRLLVSDNSNAQNDDEVVIIVNPFPQNTTFTPLQSLSLGQLSVWRIATAAAATDTKIFFAGGKAEDWYGDITAVYSRVDIYDIPSNNRTTAELSKARWGISAAKAGNKILFAGGIMENGYPSSRVDIYDITSGSWSTAELSEARSNISVASSGNKILFAGGGDEWGTVFSSTVDIYDASSNTWSKVNLSEAKTVIASASVGNKIIFAGGSNQNGDSKRVDIYDVQTNLWSETSLSEAKRITSVTTVGNTVYFVKMLGGGPCTSCGSKRVDKYDAVSEQWSVDSLNQFDFLAPTYALNFVTAGTIGNSAVFIPDNLLYYLIYNTMTNKWSLTSRMPGSFSSGQTSIVSVNNQLYIAGWEGVFKLLF